MRGSGGASSRLPASDCPFQSLVFLVAMPDSLRMNKIRAGSVQFNHAPGDKALNLKRMGEFVAEAAEKGVDLLVFPEMCVSGYWHVRNLSRDEVAELGETVPDGLSHRGCVRAR